MKNLLLTCLLVSAIQIPAASLTPFAPPWNDTAPGPTDLRGTIPCPAGADGFVTARDGHFYLGDKRLRFFGINFTAGAGMPDHATAEQVAARLAGSFESWRRYDPARQALMQAQLKSIRALPGLSSNLVEVVGKMLGQDDRPGRV